MSIWSSRSRLLPAVRRRAMSMSMTSSRLFCLSSDRLAFFALSTATVPLALLVDRGELDRGELDRGELLPKATPEAEPFRGGELRLPVFITP